MTYETLFKDLLTRVTSRKFLLVFGLGLVLLADNSLLVLDPEIRKEMVRLVLFYIGFEGGADVVSRLK